MAAAILKFDARCGKGAFVVHGDAGIGLKVKVVLPHIHIGALRAGSRIGEHAFVPAQNYHCAEVPAAVFADEAGYIVGGRFFG